MLFHASCFMVLCFGCSAVFGILFPCMAKVWPLLLFVVVVDYFVLLLSGFKYPDHVVFDCILLLSVSDCPKRLEFRLPKLKMCEF